jgi:hypothetical protein
MPLIKYLTLSISIMLLLFGTQRAANGHNDEPIKAKTANAKWEKSNVQTIVNNSEQTAVQSASNNQMSGENIDRQVISAGGTIGGTSTIFMLSGTVAQTAVGDGISGGHGLSHGFWQNLVSDSTCCETPGDANRDGTTNVGDVVYIINYVFKGGDAPICPKEGDPNSDCSINVGDAVFLISYIFKQGDTPECGCAN